MKKLFHESFSVAKSTWDMSHNKICYKTSITAPQDAHTRLVLQVYPGSNTLEFSR